MSDDNKRNFFMRNFGGGGARSEDPATSYEAAEKLDSSRLFAAVIATLQAGKRRGEMSMTADRISKLSNEPYKSISPRMRQLERVGHVRRVGTVIEEHRNRTLWEEGSFPPELRTKPPLSSKQVIAVMEQALRDIMLTQEAADAHDLAQIALDTLEENRE